MKQKYVRLKEYNSILIFPEIITHDTFKHMNPISAGFCFVNSESRNVSCCGESISLGLKSLDEDSKFATRQLFGDD